MRQVADNLKGQEYINGESVEAIRKYIRVKNPGCSEEELSVVFADALHKIIDSRIYQFEEKHRKKIKDVVLKRAVKKKEFSIDASEVFASCLMLKLQEESYTRAFTDWINHNQPVVVSIHQVDKLLSRVKQFESRYLEDNLDDIIEVFGSASVKAGTIVDEVKSEIQDEAVQAAGVNSEEIEGAEEFRWTKMLRNYCLKCVKPIVKPILTVALPAVIITVLVFTGLSGDNRVQGLRHREQGRYANISEDQVDRYITLEARIVNKLDVLTGERRLILLDGLHDELRYEAVDKSKLKLWLDGKNSMLAEEPYFTAILETSEDYDIHPVLMFAVVGQEQGFVPKSGASARKIANNPFNVYGSWEKYNTNIYDSSRLAASTIIESSRNRPAYINTIRWINRRYAEDPNWWNGVSGLFTQIKKEVADIK